MLRGFFVSAKELKERGFKFFKLLVPPVVVLVPHDSDVVIYAQLCWLFCVFYMPLFGLGQEKHKLNPKLGQIAPRNLRMSLDKRIAFKVQLRHLLRKIIRQQNMASVIRIYLLCLQTVIIAAGPGAQYRIQVSSMFTVTFMFCPSKANSWRF